MKDYYFKYIVPDHYEHEFTRFRPAQRLAKKLNEKVYLMTFHVNNSYNEPYHEEVISSSKEIVTAKKKLIRLFYEFTKTSPMTPQDYRIAYRFLKIRATKQGQIAPFRETDFLPEEQQLRIYKFLKYNHQVKFF